MNDSMFFTICSLFYSVLLICIFFSKKRINLFENKIYSSLIIVNFLGIIVEIACSQFILIYGMEHEFLSICIGKAYLMYLITWITLFTMYIVVISTKNIETKIIPLVKGILLVLILLYVIVIMLPMHYYYDSVQNKYLYSYGPSVDFVSIVSIICFIICLFFTFRNIKNIKKKKYIPLFVFIVIGTIVLIVQNSNPSLLLVTSAETFVTILMYFTIENPDLKLINELNMAKDQAEKANRAKTDFLSSMSHEIRTPLNAIVGFSNSLNDNKDIPESAKADVKDILVASDNLLEIVNGVLDISKIEANKIEIIKKEYDTKKMLDELSKLTKVRIGEKPIEFITKFDESLPRVLYGDQTRVKQVILNILTNAAKYTDKGKIIFSVQSIIKDNVCRMIVSVEDTGRGIKKESIDKLFTKFERLDEDRNTTIEGTGLGLAITKKLVELMHGKIVVQSKYGEGSKFTVSIDQKIVKNPTISLDDNNSSNIETLDLKGKKVLVVDDNKLNLKVATRLLTPYNLEITTSESGFDAIELLKNNKYDIILMDDMMPKMSGTETLKEIQKNKLYDGPIVALTANALTGMREKYIEHGFTDYLAKPIEKSELNRVLKTYLTKK